MYVNYLNYRTQLSYEALKDNACGIQTVRIINSKTSLMLVYTSKISGKTKKITVVFSLVVLLVFGNAQPSKAIGFSTLPVSMGRVLPSLQHPLKEIKVAPTVNPRLDKILMISTNRMIPLVVLNDRSCFINHQLLKKLRGGSLSVNLTLIAFGVVVFVMYQLQLPGVDAFGIIGPWNVPTIRPGFPPTTSSSYSSTKIALVPTKAQEFNDMLSMYNTNKPQLNFVMTRDEALNLIGETYPGQLEITVNERFSEWQAAKKIYHAVDFGIDPEDYGMMKYNILRLQRIGLTKYAREGRPLPPIKLVNHYQMAVKNMCDHSEHSDGKFSSRGEQKIHDTSYSYNRTTRQVAGFNKETGDIITAGKYRPQYFDRFLETMHLGRL